MAVIRVKRGDTFDRLLLMPETAFADGYFVDWTIASQIRTSTGRLVGELTPSWADPAEDTRYLRLVAENTTKWPIGVHELDAQFTDPDGFVMSTETVQVEVIRDITL